MTLSVHTWIGEPGYGAAQFLPTEELGWDMAGCESARREVWGSAAVIRRGATFLPRMADDDCWVLPGELDAFEAEVGRLEADLGGLLADLGWGPDSTLPHYLSNFRRAIVRARACGGGVNIG